MRLQPPSRDDLLDEFYSDEETCFDSGRLNNITDLALSMIAVIGSLAYGARLDRGKQGYSSKCSGDTRRLYDPWVCDLKVAEMGGSFFVAIFLAY
jgi:hypothetical protein